MLTLDLEAGWRRLQGDCHVEAPSLGVAVNVAADYVAASVQVDVAVENEIEADTAALCEVVALAAVALWLDSWSNWRCSLDKQCAVSTVSNREATQADPMHWHTCSRPESVHS